MKKSIYYIILSILLLGACKEPKREAKGNGLIMTEDVSSSFSIEILDDQALELINPKSKIEVLADGFEWTEGPLWIKEGNYLLFSDIPNNKVHKWDVNGKVSTYLYPSGHSDAKASFKEPGSNGLLLNPKGELVLMQHGNRQVAKMNATLDDPNSDFISLADNYKGKKLNSPNDGVFDTEGNLYFTDPPYGLPKRMDDPAKELDFQGVYCLLHSGELLLIDETLTRPNGIALSPDEQTLFVAVSDEKRAGWYAYTLTEPGKVADKKLFFDVTYLVGIKGQKGLPDGMKMHSEGYLFATGPGGVWIFDLTGKPMARIHTGQATANCAFGTDEKKLFMTADDYILSVDLK